MSAALRASRSPILASSCGRLARSVPSVVSTVMRRPLCSPAEPSTVARSGTGTSARAKSSPTPGTSTGRPRNSAHSPVRGLRSGPMMDTAPWARGAAEAPVGSSSGRSREAGRAAAQVEPSGRSSTRSRNWKFWKSSSWSSRLAAGALSRPLWATRPIMAGSPASVPSTDRKWRFSVPSATRATRCTVARAASSAVLRIRSISRAAPTSTAGQQQAGRNARPRAGDRASPRATRSRAQRPRVGAMCRFQVSAQSAPQRRTQLGSTTSRRSSARSASSWSRSSTIVMRPRLPSTQVSRPALQARPFSVSTSA